MAELLWEESLLLLMVFKTGLQRNIRHGDDVFFLI